ncbi:unnamed protein product (mitochondrion) [Plasmodiophora brassicae]|uniref:Uncharacterized protein n=1 Tax=Plasmodiophora brassicae TaxID=37360 RepID=A0A0G4J1N3_PLABS|nr:hypothetical protein PBRA_002091 [Plasmodiophora brassicae]SPQ93234.1 unnamed protein product [Plasmodiophora brassicae]
MGLRPRLALSGSTQRGQHDYGSTLQQVGARMFAFIITWITRILMGVVLIGVMGAIRQWLTRSNKVASLTVGFGNLFERGDAVVEDQSSEDDDSDSIATSPTPKPEVSSPTIPTTTSTPTTAESMSSPATKQGPVPHPVVVTPDPVPAPVTLASSAPGIDDGNGSVFQALVMLCTRSNHLPRDALHDLVTSEANSGSIQAFQEDILRTLIDNGAQDPKDQPRRHAPTIVGRSSALRQESPSARKRSVSEESLRLPRGAATDDESSTDDDMQSAADLDKAVKIGASSTSLQDAIQRMTEWDAESDHEWRKLVDACRDARFSTLRRICNEMGISPDDPVYTDTLRPHIEHINAGVSTGVHNPPVNINKQT